MKPVQTKFGQALQIAETRQQVAGLQVQVEKLKSDIKELRDMDRQIFDDQDNEIAALKALTRDYQRILASLPDVSVWGCDYSTFANWQQQKDELEVRAQQLIGEGS
jgi:TolA-binding protein